jgi:hypothetical protein
MVIQATSRVGHPIDKFHELTKQSSLLPPKLPPFVVPGHEFRLLGLLNT